jgi:hypothetical protein
LVHRKAAEAATKYKTQDAHLKIVRKTGSSTNKMQHALGCEYLHIMVNRSQLTLQQTAGVCRELRDQFIAARNGNDPWSTKTFVRTAHKIQHHNVLSSGICMDEFPEKHPQEWTKQAVITIGDATEAYMVEVIAASRCLKQ